MILTLLSSPSFYNRWVKPPTTDSPIPDAIHNQPKWSPFFDSVIGAIDGTHINCIPSAKDIQLAHNCKGGVSQNCLAVVSMDMHFQYFISGWDGCAADSSMYSKARMKDFPIPEGHRYLADAGFGICNSLLVPFWNIRYHLAEWGRANIRQAIFSTIKSNIETVLGHLIQRSFIIFAMPPLAMLLSEYLV